LHAFYAEDFVDTARPPTAYSRADSVCHAISCLKQLRCIIIETPSS